MIALSFHTRVDTTDHTVETTTGRPADVAPRATVREALNTILVMSPGSPSMWLFK